MKKKMSFSKKSDPRDGTKADIAEDRKKIKPKEKFKKRK